MKISLNESQQLPVLFIGHGSPMTAITDNPFRQSWSHIATKIPKPQAVLCISAHWETPTSKVLVSQMPRTIHDFSGFPPELYAQEYPAPGAPQFAELLIRTVTSVSVGADTAWGFDHGAWCILKSIFPHADVPTFQLSLSKKFTATEHYQLGRELKPLREQGVLIVCSGNIVHNLARLRPGPRAWDWAEEFDAVVSEKISDNNHEALMKFASLSPAARNAVPTTEHFLPLLYALGAAGTSANSDQFISGFDLGALSMRSVLFT